MNCYTESNMWYFIQEAQLWQRIHKELEKPLWLFKTDFNCDPGVQGGDLEANIYLDQENEQIFA